MRINVDQFILITSLYIILKCIYQELNNPDESAGTYYKYFISNRSDLITTKFCQ